LGNPSCGNVLEKGLGRLAARRAQHVRQKWSARNTESLRPPQRRLAAMEIASACVAAADSTAGKA